MLIRDKQQMRELHEQGAFGNRLRTWGVGDLGTGSIMYPVGLRYSGEPGIVLPNYCVKLSDEDETRSLICQWMLSGVRHADRIVIAEFQPAGKVFHAEVQRSERYIDLYWAEATVPMRLALYFLGHNSSGLEAVTILKRHLDAASWDNLQRLWDEFPDSVVELSAFAQSAGTLRHNTVFWEVRNY